jgi:hypothetical protein
MGPVNRNPQRKGIHMKLKSRKVPEPRCPIFTAGLRNVAMVLEHIVHIMGAEQSAASGG